MARHIGIVACSSEGAALCYRTICAEAGERMGPHAHPEISLHHYSLADYLEHIRARDWTAVAQLMSASARKLAQIGADFLICPDNTIHQAFDRVESESPIPWLHIARCVADEARRFGFRTLAITGTRSLMGSAVYPEILEPLDIAYHLPDAEDRDEIERIIHDELVCGIIREQSRHTFNQIVARLKEKGCDAVVLGCTELPLLVDPLDCPLPTLDSTRLLARAALDYALDEASSPARSPV